MGPWSADRRVLRSRHVGDEFVVGVTRPHGYDRGAGSYPLLVTLDAHWLYGTVADLATSLSMGRLVPRALVAGVGWPTDDLAEVARYRQRDTTPTAAAFPDNGSGEQPPRYGVGGAAAFRRFLLDELLPGLLDEHRVGGPKVLIGHSLTALFATHVLLNEPTAFDAYLLASPSLWWDDRVTLRVIEPEIAARRRALPARVYLSAGGEEGADSRSQPFNMVGNVAELARRLRRYEAIDVHVEVLDGETHHSTLGQSVSRGLRHLLGPVRPGP